MSVLMWEKPKQVTSKEDWKENQADGAVPGTWAPNMSREDQMRWKAKVVGATLGFPQVEIRRNGMVIVLSKKGYKYNGYDFRQTLEFFEKRREYEAKYKDSLGDPNVVHIASSGAQCFSPAEFAEFQQAIAEGLARLDELESGPAAKVEQPKKKARK